MRFLKSICLFAIVIIILILPSSSEKNISQWYRINQGEAQINEILITSQTTDKLHLEASCFEGANMGFFSEDFTLVSEDEAIYSGESYRGDQYVIRLTFEDDIMKISVEHSENNPEWVVLGFGNLVTMSGEYSKERPVFDYSDIVFEKVFLHDDNLSNVVRQYLGEEKYASFISHFGMSTYINIQNENGYRTIIGSLRGIGNWCAFCSTSDGFFYGIDNYKYFTNDPIYKDAPPSFLESFNSFLS